MYLAFSIKDRNCLVIELREGRHIIDQETLTIGQKLDKLLITSIDKLLKKNRIERLSLKTAKILGKVEDRAVSGMILKTIVSALEI